ncbi:MAG: TetR/AcrR family transcriptional regulator [Actinomycetota bacterium]|nr:TetR/AcrR family transcriptional regulator [Actinomycetota bacterium]
MARDVFLEKGFSGATMDEVATRARISKASLYREHPSKTALYAAVVSDWADAGRDAMRPALDRLLAGSDTPADLADLGMTIREGVLSSTVLAMRRLVTSETRAHPEVARRYFSESWDRNIQDLSVAFEQLNEQRRLVLDDPRRAAEEFTWLIVGAPLNEALLTGAAAENAPTVDSAVRLFLSRYARH